MFNFTCNTVLAGNCSILDRWLDTKTQITMIEEFCLMARVNGPGYRPYLRDLLKKHEQKEKELVFNSQSFMASYH